MSEAVVLLREVGITSGEQLEYVVKLPMDIANEYDGGTDELEVGLTQEHLLHAPADCSN